MHTIAPYAAILQDMSERLMRSHSLLLLHRADHFVVYSGDTLVLKFTVDPNSRSGCFAADAPDPRSLSSA